MKLSVLIGVLVFGFLPLMAQDEAIDFDYIEVERDSTVYRTDEPTKKFKKLQTGVDVSMGYSFSSRYSGPMFALSPYVSYPLNNKFSISAGMSVGYSGFYSPYYNTYGENNMLPMTRMFLYVSGHYHVNARLTVTGSVYTQVLDVPNTNPTTGKRNFNSVGASMGFQYKLTDNISVGAQIRVEDPGMYSPYSPVNNPYNQTGSTWW